MVCGPLADDRMVRTCLFSWARTLETQGTPHLRGDWSLPVIHRGRSPPTMPATLSTNLAVPVKNLSGSQKAI